MGKHVEALLSCIHFPFREVFKCMFIYIPPGYKQSDLNFHAYRYLHDAAYACGDGKVLFCEYNGCMYHVCGFCFKFTYRKKKTDLPQLEYISHGNDFNIRQEKDVKQLWDVTKHDCTCWAGYQAFEEDWQLLMRTKSTIEPCLLAKLFGIFLEKKKDCKLHVTFKAGIGHWGRKFFREFYNSCNMPWPSISVFFFHVSHSNFTLSLCTKNMQHNYAKCVFSSVSNEITHLAHIMYAAVRGGSRPLGAGGAHQH